MSHTHSVLTKTAGLLRVGVVAGVLALQTGCAQLEIPGLQYLPWFKKEPVPLVSDAIGVVSIVPEKVVAPTIRVLTLSDTVPLDKKSGMLVGAGTGLAGGLAAGAGACSPSVILPGMYGVCVAVSGMIGLLGGGTLGLFVGKDIEKRSQVDVKEFQVIIADLQVAEALSDRLRLSIIEQAKKGGNLGIADLGTRSALADKDGSLPNVPRYILSTQLKEILGQLSDSKHLQFGYVISTQFIDTSGGEKPRIRDFTHMGQPIPRAVSHADSLKAAELDLQATLSEIARMVVAEQLQRPARSFP